MMRCCNTCYSLRHNAYDEGELFAPELPQKVIHFSQHIPLESRSGSSVGNLPPTPYSVVKGESSRLTVALPLVLGYAVK